MLALCVSRVSCQIVLSIWQCAGKQECACAQVHRQHDMLHTSQGRYTLHDSSKKLMTDGVLAVVAPKAWLLKTNTKKQLAWLQSDRVLAHLRPHGQLHLHSIACASSSTIVVLVRC